MSASQGFLAVPGADLVAARQQAHTAAQLLASAAQTYLPPRADSSESAMRWAQGHLVSQAFDGVTLHLDPGLLVILVQGPEGEMRLDLEGRSPSQALEALATALGQQGVAFKPWRIPDWDTPMGPLMEQGAFAVQPEGAVLTRAYQAAAELLAQVERDIPKAGPALCWPHHFDLACLVAVASDEKGKLSQSIGIGMSPGDSGIPAPYLYVTPWPAPEDWQPAALKLGDWNKTWVGALLHYRDWPGDVGVRAFVEEAAAACRGVLAQT